MPTFHNLVTSLHELTNTMKEAHSDFAQVSKQLNHDYSFYSGAITCVVYQQEKNSKVTSGSIKVTGADVDVAVMFSHLVEHIATNNPTALPIIISRLQEMKIKF